MFCAEVDEGICQPSGIDGIAVRVCIVGLNALRELPRNGKRPVRTFIEGRNEDLFILGLKLFARFKNGLLEDVLGRGVGVERLTFLDAD